MDSPPTLDFWYDLGSTYSYIAAMRAQKVAGAAGVRLAWRPFLLGPIFKSQGWETSPFFLYPAKGRYMWRDMARLAEEEGLPLTAPEPFPQNSVLAARVCLAVEEARRPQVTRAIFTAEFGRGETIADAEGLKPVLAALGLDGDAVLARAVSDEVKGRLRAETDAAVAAGVFGAPSFVTADGDLFWGNDRLERAVSAARALAAV